MKHTVVVGVGSVVRTDDGIGPRVIEKLQEHELPKSVDLRSGDISGLDLLKYLPGYKRVIIIDAADMKEPPGSIKVFSLDQIKLSSFSNVQSTHGMALLETLTLADQLDDITDEIYIIGIQPVTVSHGLALSPLLKSKIPCIIECVKKVVKRSRQLTG